jgi:hypothetical protein
MIIIPMAGKSSRFIDAGYDKPKYKLQLLDKTVFDWVVLSFKEHFRTEQFIFIVQMSFEMDNFTEKHIKNLGILNYRIHLLNEITRGQAETVYKSIINEENDQDILIFNIDTIRKNFTYPKISNTSAGCLEVFKGDGDHWSFIEPYEEDNKFVKRTTEKIRITNLCSNGLYYFKSLLQFKKSFEEAIRSNEYSNGEIYIAPLYNNLIKNGYKIEYTMTPFEDNIFCGTPLEYQSLIHNDSYLRLNDK